MKSKSAFDLKTGIKSNRLLLLISVLFLLSFTSFSQSVSINTSGALPDNSAGLEISVPNSGFLIPRVALTGTANAAPLASHVAGMILYNTANAGDVTPGFYFNDGTKWVAFSLFNGQSTGDMFYWNGTKWASIPAGRQGQRLQLTSTRIPAWSDGNTPSLTTTAATSITTTTANSGGNITSDGGSTVTARGVCWNNAPAPTTANQFTIDGSGMGTFTSNITGLASGTTYYVRSYATNNNGTAYGNEITFTTP
jgi:hypothetical protein